MVGGCVRDSLLGVSSKDYDIEVYGLSYSQMIDALKGYFRINQVGQSFNVLKIGNEIDLTIPRRESKQGIGHKGFSVEADPNMTFKEAAGRRDFTINAIGMRVDGSFCDPYDGIGDLKRKILRAPTNAFCDDPLRVLRGMQFASRFGFDMEPRTIDLCKKVLPEFSALSQERLFFEWEKWACKGKFPSKGLQVLQKTGWLSCFPDLARLEQTPITSRSNVKNVYESTMKVCNIAAQLADRVPLDDKNRALLLFAALCHDFGRVIATIQSVRGTWNAPLHAIVGLPAVEQFFLNMKSPLWFPETVLPLCRNHSIYRCIKTDLYNIPDRVLRKMAKRLEPASIILWSCLEAAIYYAHYDVFSPDLWEDSSFYHWIERAKQLHVSEKKQDPLLLGRDLILKGVTPGPNMKVILDAAYRAQMNGDIMTKEEAGQWFDEYQKK